LSKPQVLHDFADGSYEPDVEFWLQKICDSASITRVVVIGANMGYTLALSMAYFGTQPEYIAVEPVPELFQNLETLKGWNPQFRLRLVQKALSDKSGEHVRFYVSDGAQIAGSSLFLGWTPENHPIQVETTVLPDILGAEKDLSGTLIICDIEGAECFLFEQLAALMRTAAEPLPPRCIVEVSDVGLSRMDDVTRDYLSTIFRIYNCHNPLLPAGLDNNGLRRNLCLIPKNTVSNG
jgi:FkbM family methyltransferase